MVSTALAGDFSVGQIWSYQTRDHEAESKLTIVQIDRREGKEIIHISIDGLRIKNPQAPSGYGSDISHLPISPKALKASVTKLSGQAGILSNYKEGYQIWREAFDSGQGGFFTISVAESVDYLEQAINQ
ncbi:hypothetical protein GCM10008090_01060 [Arenicella chitinivorans]|uniref:Uncharacterized protein n=2 Tax=Arenicella chitinivorans TaxID=1329800 RepID=A0A918RIX3_9GAMM|nr:hypothetical protein GCM10008090_01060 [Arenicella chitinivorans]